MQNINEKALAVTAEVSKAVLGKPEVVLKIMMAILARGHVLIEDIPGVGKTACSLPPTFCRPTLWGSRCTKRKPANLCTTPAR